MPIHISRFRYNALLVSMMFSLTAAPCAHANLLLQQDFNGPDTWTQLSVSAAPLTADLPIHASQEMVGTVDVANSTTPSGAALLTVGPLMPRRTRSAAITSGLLPVKTRETNLGKLTLSFDHSVSSVRPVTVQIESFDGKKKRTGGLEGIVYPAAADFYLRAALDLSLMHPFGAGNFRSKDPFVKLTFQISSLPVETKEADQTQLCIDNGAYASPAYYVSPHGKDTNDGHSEKTAFATPQKAINAAQPGDIILLMDGTYHRPQTLVPQEPVVKFDRAGTPAAWITLKNYPGQKSVLTSDSWSALSIASGTRSTTSEEPALAYLEVRGLTIRGEADVAKTRYSQWIGTDDPRTNGNGIIVMGSFTTHPPHHLRFANNVIEFCHASGLTIHDADWIIAEKNVVRNNCWTTVYEGAGLGLFGGLDFNPSDHYKILVRGNQVYGNRCFVKSRYAKQIFNGNGLMIDGNNEQPKRSYQGRTLVQNNLAYGNGGVGIQMWGSRRMDLVNNTVYFNGTSPELRWGQVAVTICDDVRFINNIIVAQADRPLNTWYGNKENRVTHVVRQQNLYFGGNTSPIPGEGDVIADPQFVSPTLNATDADFHVRSGSPALKSGWQGDLLPLLDLDGKSRLTATAPDRGAYQQ